MHYAVFTPGTGIIDAQRNLARVGLSELFEPGSAESRGGVLAVGNKSLKGVFVTHVGNDTDYDETHYDWTPSPPCGEHQKGAYYVGLHRQHKCGPGHLARKDQHEGTGVVLRDGNVWTVPSAYLVPKTFGVDLDTGEMGAHVDQRFRRYCMIAADHAEQIYSQHANIELVAKVYGGIELSGEEEAYVASLLGVSKDEIDKEALAEDQLMVKLDLDNLAEQSIAGLAFNYRVNAFIVTLLELLDQDAAGRCVLAAIDMPQVARVLKKNEPGYVVSIPVLQDT